MYGRITPQLLFAPVGNSGLMSFASLASTDAALGRLRLQLKLRLFCFLVSTRLEQGAQLSSLVVNECYRDWLAQVQQKTDPRD